MLMTLEPTSARTARRAPLHPVRANGEGFGPRVGGCALHTGAVVAHVIDGPAATPHRPVCTVDYHTAGEPFRIVVDPGVAIRGGTVAERRVLAQKDPAVDGLRRLLCYEPRGYADMYGGFLTPPDDEGAHLGVLFWHKDGFSTACGHGTIALMCGGSRPASSPPCRARPPT